MEQATSDNLTNVGAAALIVIIFLKIIFDYLKSRDTANKKTTTNEPEPCFGIKEQRMLNVMAVQLAEVHTTLQVTQIFQKSLITIVENQTRQTQILGEVVELNKNTTEVLERISRILRRREREDDDDSDI